MLLVVLIEELLNTKKPLSRALTHKWQALIEVKTLNVKKAIERMLIKEIQGMHSGSKSKGSQMGSWSNHNLNKEEVSAPTITITRTPYLSNL